MFDLLVVSVLNDTTLNGLAKALEMAVKSYTEHPQTNYHPYSPTSRWPHKEAKFCVQLLEPCVMLVPHRQSGGGPLQTASMGLKGGGAETQRQGGKGAICWDKGNSSGAGGPTRL